MLGISPSDLGLTLFWHILRLCFLSLCLALCCNYDLPPLLATCLFLGIWVLFLYYAFIACREWLIPIIPSDCRGYTLGVLDFILCTCYIFSCCLVIRTSVSPFRMDIQSSLPMLGIFSEFYAHSSHALCLRWLLWPHDSFVVFPLLPYGWTVPWASCCDCLCARFFFDSTLGYVHVVNAGLSPFLISSAVGFLSITFCFWLFRILAIMQWLWDSLISSWYCVPFASCILGSEVSCWLVSSRFGSPFTNGTALCVFPLDVFC